LGALTLVILAFAFYPQFGLRRSEPTVNATLLQIALPEAVAASPVSSAAR
jgi:hypothetical protein